jgi:antitoxin ParD1/3/4
MNISLPPELEAYVAGKVASGLYGSQSEVVREALRLLIDRDRLNELRLGQLRTDIAEGLDQAQRGELVPGDVVRKEIRSASRQKRRRVG